MALEIKNLTNQVIPITVETSEVRLMPRETIIVALESPTTQIKRLEEKKIVKVRTRG